MDAKSEVRKTQGSRLPTFHAELCARFGVPPIDFDGEHDALLHAFDRRGRQPRNTPGPNPLCGKRLPPQTGLRRRAQPPIVHRARMGGVDVFVYRGCSELFINQRRVKTTSP